MQLSVALRRSLFAVALITSFAITPAIADERSELTAEAKDAVAAMVKKDPSLSTEITASAGYAIFPGVGKGAIGIGGARGTGQVIVNDAPVAKVTLTQVTVGLQLGGQKYVEMILFENKDALDQFLSGKFTLTAQATAVALQSGASANAKYAGGVKVVTMALGGLMYEAAVGGQKFNVDKY
jgi:lipid-binding SYLF domain-containing protein